jgi:pimeloyl-ACP methyl ester carboxylesterase
MRARHRVGAAVFPGVLLLGLVVAASAAPKPGAHPCTFNEQLVCGRISVPLDRLQSSDGRLPIHYVLIPRRDTSKPLLGTIVAVEGGPGYATTESRAYYREMFGPLLDQRRLLLVDQRGTGRSGAINCPWLQSYKGNRIKAVGACGSKLGAAADDYGSAIAADDLAAVLDRLDVKKIDLYGDSYGTFFSQTFAARYPERVRTLTLDAAYFVGGTNPWYPDTNRALRRAFAFACQRSPSCADRPGSAMQRMRALAALVRRHPIRGVASNSYGVDGRINININKLIWLVTGAGYSNAVYREFDAAARAALRPHPYDKPLLRLMRETLYVGGAGPYRAYSEGMFLAVSCLDYPQPFDMRASIEKRRVQYQHAVDRLRQNHPHVFAPFTVREWTKSGYGYFKDCIRWPKPTHWVHPVKPNQAYPDVPTLILNGDLDTVTSSDGAKDTAAHWPNSTFVRTANMVHVSALVDFDQCASVIVRRFVRTTDPGDRAERSCASRYHENRLVDRFARTADGTGWPAGALRDAKIANATLADVLARFYEIYGHTDVGLQGGHWRYRGGAFTKSHPVAVYTLHKVRWVKDVAVSGTMRWHRKSGVVEANVRVTGPGAHPGVLRLTWNDLDRHAVATARGTIAGQPVSFTFPSA